MNKLVYAHMIIDLYSTCICIDLTASISIEMLNDIHISFSYAMTIYIPLKIHICNIIYTYIHTYKYNVYIILYISKFVICIPRSAPVKVDGEGMSLKTTGEVGDAFVYEYNT